MSQGHDVTGVREIESCGESQREIVTYSVSRMECDFNLVVKNKYKLGKKLWAIFSLSIRVSFGELGDEDIGIHSRVGQYFDDCLGTLDC